MTANELFLLHGAQSLNQYWGNLEWFCKAVDDGHVPPADDETVRTHVELLKRRMGLAADAVLSENDELLLRVGLIVPGLMRGIHPPVSVLNPERGGFSDKRLDQAAGQVRRLQEGLRIARRHFGELGPDSVASLRHLLQRLTQMTRRDSAWIDAHARLPESEFTSLVCRALACLEESKESAELGTRILACLANFRSQGLGRQTAELLKRDLFWPSSLYRDAPDEVAEGLIQRIERTKKSDRLRLNHLLLSLAWTRGKTARLAFLNWRNSPPTWTEVLHVPPEEYLPYAGWEIDSKGNRRELISLSSHQIAPFATGSSEQQVPVPCRTGIEMPCPACHSPLAWLFDFSNLPGEYFSGDRRSAPKRVLCCLHCSCLGPAFFSRYDLDGTAEVHLPTKSEETESMGERPAVVWGLVPHTRPAFAAAEPFQISDVTGLGGCPMWLQDAEYPRCPECEEVMMFLAQLDNSAMKPAEEGIYYSFFCPRCRVAAVNYQQT